MRLNLLDRCCQGWIVRKSTPTALIHRSPTALNLTDVKKCFEPDSGSLIADTVGEIERCGRNKAEGVNLLRIASVQIAISCKS